MSIRNYILALLGFRVPRVFKPCVIYDDLAKCTELVLEDTGTVWHSPRGFHNTVDLGYSFDGRLIAVRIWGDHRIQMELGLQHKIKKVEAEMQADINRRLFGP